MNALGVPHVRVGFCGSGSDCKCLLTFANLRLEVTLCQLVFVQ